jgi:PPK2 family polyphosphate:nucleotide phosphotransferase
MKISEQFRLSKKFKVKDDDAATKPLSSGDKSVDKRAVELLADEIAALQDIFYAEHKRKLLVILQGMDSSGKDGTIRGVFDATDPLGIRTVAFKAPSTVEKEHDYLWRIHMAAPGQGEIVIFNRSHYEDVLVPRVHGWIDEKECRQRYAHIRDFERMLTETGTVIVKFFLHISKDEQKARLQARLDDPQKHWKFDPQDLEERKLWTDYQSAYTELLAETDTGQCPWYVVPADSKTHRNLVVASVLKEVLEDMKLAYPTPHPEYAALKVE